MEMARNLFLQSEQEKRDLFGTSHSALTKTTAVQCNLDMMRRMTPTYVNLLSEVCISESSVNSQFDPWFNPTCSVEIAVALTVA